MSIENATDLFNKAFAPTAAPSNTGGRVDANGNPLPQSKIWLDIGIPMPAVDPTTGEKIMDFVSLPVNLGIDTMKRREVPTRAPKTAAAKLYRDRIVASNKLLDILQTLAASLAEGDTRALDDTPLKLQLRRVEEGQTEDQILAEENPFADALAKAFGI